MGLFGFIKFLLAGGAKSEDAAPGRSSMPDRFSMADLSMRLGRSVDELAAFEPHYTPFSMRKRTGGTRTILAPDPATKDLQRRILRRLFGRLRTHPAATGFQPGVSIAHNATPHAGKAVVLKMDIREFFGSTTETRVKQYFRTIGWDGESANVLTRLCCAEGGLPQGAPTSPRLSNLVNCMMDARMAALAQSFDAVYTRYADDFAFSFLEDKPSVIRCMIGSVKCITRDYGYALHQDRKLQIKRAYERQKVCGLVVNDRPRLPRETRRWLRAVEHHYASDRPMSITPEQLAGWRALQQMVERQSRAASS
jgi:RNA-directed DNA polymerase